MVRSATTADSARLARMLHEFNLEFGEPSPGEEFLAARVTTLILSDAKTFLVAGEGAGFTQVDIRPSVWSEGPTAQIEELYVEPGRRGRGLGRELMAEVLNLARDRGAAMVEVVTGEDDTAARGLYESTGFRNQIEGEAGARALYYELEL